MNVSSCQSRLFVLFSVVACLAIPRSALCQDREFRPRVVIPADRFKPITEFPIVSAAAAKIADHELVLGVAVGGEARAYPINMLTGPSREILNDEVGDISLAATW